MSIFNYNGINLPYVTTNQFNQEVLYDEVAQTDWYLTRYDIRVNAVICQDYLGGIDPSLVGDADLTDPAAIMKDIRNRLMQPRNRLQVSFNGTNIIPDNTLTGTVDAKNGPMPQHCNIIELNNTTFIIDYRIIAHYWESSLTTLSTSPSNTGLPASANNPVLYNRWSESVALNECQMTTRTREGTYCIRSDNGAGKVADFFRPQFAIVGIPNGFLRESSEYTQAPDGLTLKYRVVDAEQFKMPPQPAFKARGKYTESTAARGGARRMCEVAISLEGAKNTPQSDLIGLACAIAVSKLAINGVGPGLSSGTATDKKGILEYASIEVDMYENKVAVNMRMSAPPRTLGNQKGRAFGVAGINYTGMTFTPYTDSPVGFPIAGPFNTANGQFQVPAPNYQDRGTAGILLLAAAYYDPALQGNILNRQTGQMIRGLVPGEAGVL